METLFPVTAGRDPGAGTHILIGDLHGWLTALKHSAGIYSQSTQGKLQLGDCLVQFRMYCAELFTQRRQELMSAGDVLYRLGEWLYASLGFICLWIIAFRFHCKYLLNERAFAGVNMDVAFIIPRA